MVKLLCGAGIPRPVFSDTSEDGFVSINWAILSAPLLHYSVSKLTCFNQAFQRVIAVWCQGINRFSWITYVSLFPHSSDKTEGKSTFFCNFGHKLCFVDKCFHKDRLTTVASLAFWLGLLDRTYFLCCFSNQKNIISMFLICCPFSGCGTCVFGCCWEQQ